MNKENIFITGASGFVGQNLIAYLNKNKANFSIHAFLHKNKLKDGLSVDDISYGDIVDYGSLEKSFSKDSIDVIIHLAAAIKSPNEKDHLDVNVKGTQNIVKLAEKYRVKKVIFFSTDFVLYNITHPYRESKLQCEKIFSKSNLNFTIFRPAPIYGPGDNKNFAALIPLIKKNLIIPSVKCKMEPVYVGDVVKMVATAIDSPQSDRKIYNLPGGSFDEFSNIINIISQSLELKRIIAPIPRKFFLLALKIYNKIVLRPLLESYQVEKWLQNQPMDASEIKRDLGYNPLAFEQGIKLTIKV